MVIESVIEDLNVKNIVLEIKKCFCFGNVAVYETVIQSIMNRCTI